LKKTYGPFHIFFTVNAFTAWCGNILKKIGLVQKTVFWVWDYYPPIHEDKVIMLMRTLYWIFDKAAIHSDIVAFLNIRLINLRKKIGVLSQSSSYPVVSIGTDLHIGKKKRMESTLTFAFLGALKKSQGLDYIFDHAIELKKRLPPCRLHVFGGGPDEGYFRNRAHSCPIPVTFFGYIPDSKKMNTLLSRCDIGLAPYIPDPGNVSYYSDPSKIKAYISNGIPVIMTNVFQFSKEIQKSKAGIVFRYNDTKGFIKAVYAITRSYSSYQKNALALAKKYYYKTMYPKLFSGI
jgi:glycosyltransferase involved in cell wall biosynthesis